MKTLNWFMSVQVVSRNEDKTLREWYDGEKVKTLSEAKQNAKAESKMFPGVEYVAVGFVVTEY